VKSLEIWDDLHRGSVQLPKNIIGEWKIRNNNGSFGVFECFGFLFFLFCESFSGGIFFKPNGILLIHVWICDSNYKQFLNITNKIIWKLSNFANFRFDRNSKGLIHSNCGTIPQIRMIERICILVLDNIGWGILRLDLFIFKITRLIGQLR